MAYRIKGGASCIWGISETSTAGNITDVSLSDTASTENCETQEGAVDGVVIYDVATVAKLTIVASASGSAPAIGDTLTVGAVSGVVLSVEESKSHKGKKKFMLHRQRGKILSLDIIWKGTAK